MTKRGTWGTILLGLGFVFCPCHLLITLPLLAAWLGGMAISGFLGANLAFIAGLSSVLFVAFMELGWRLISQKDTCNTEPNWTNWRRMVSRKTKTAISEDLKAVEILEAD